MGFLGNSSIKANAFISPADSLLAENQAEALGAVTWLPRWRNWKPRLVCSATIGEIPPSPQQVAKTLDPMPKYEPPPSLNFMTSFATSNKFKKACILTFRLKFARGWRARKRQGVGPPRKSGHSRTRHARWAGTQPLAGANLNLRIINPAPTATCVETIGSSRLAPCSTGCAASRTFRGSSLSLERAKEMG